ncbi:hypothetical protein AB433_04660 [Croceicoccus naphthovorans]|uniref:Poly(Beta-D-mannuronate) lyase n=2 Tax=Croceicoccus naphthovorans TaxID=1348774 RepID=A0A0G3XGA4_9SPHN|nr:hypothetical protein AB433_04660 [Croceicoccus naphthovorans]
MILMLAVPAHAGAADRHVRNSAEFARVVGSLQPGDTIVLADGTWRDFDIALVGEGRLDRPITLRGETPGGVILSGNSSLTLTGQWLVVRDLVFRDGHSTKGAVISFRAGKGRVANNSRVTNVVIDGFSKPDRVDSDYWVALYGKGNRFDHNHLTGKTNQGVTLAVVLDGDESRENGHRIDHNYFGPRQPLGSNGGETIRIGTSGNSMHRSETLVEANIFDRCDGEVEIISSKSGGNIYRGNLFLRSSGALTLRHGDDNLVEGNVFLGHGKPHTGGIRVINRGQTVRNNYMEGLRGTGFASALTVMNGVPNSPLNRYVAVDRATIENNTIVDSARITLGAGADEERSAPPTNSTFRRNLIGGVGAIPGLAVESDIGGIRFADNVVPQTAPEPWPGGTMRQPVDMVRGPNGLLYPTDATLAELGARRDLAVVAPDAVGVRWYARPDERNRFGDTGRIITVNAASGDLLAALADARSGDTLVLSPGAHVFSRPIRLDKVLTIRGASFADAGNTTVRLVTSEMVDLVEGGALRLQDLTIDGSRIVANDQCAIIRTGDGSMQRNTAIELSHIAVRNFTGCVHTQFVSLAPNTMADRVIVEHSEFVEFPGPILNAVEERDDEGRYNVEHAVVTGNRFRSVEGPVVALYRGGKDESTFGPSLIFVGNDLQRVGAPNSDEQRHAIALHGVQSARISGNAIDRSGAIAVVQTVGTPRLVITGNTFRAAPAPEITEMTYAGPSRAEVGDNIYEQ